RRRARSPRPRGRSRTASCDRSEGRAPSAAGAAARAPGEPRPHRAGAGTRRSSASPTRVRARGLSPFEPTLRPIMTARLRRYGLLRVRRRLGAALVVDAFGAQVLAQEDVVLPRLVVLLGALALLGRQVRPLLGALELVLVPPRANAVEEAHDESV